MKPSDPPTTHTFIHSCVTTPLPLQGPYCIEARPTPVQADAFALPAAALRCKGMCCEMTAATAPFKTESLRPSPLASTTTSPESMSANIATVCGRRNRKLRSEHICRARRGAPAWCASMHPLPIPYTSHSTARKLLLSHQADGGKQSRSTRQSCFKAPSRPSPLPQVSRDSSAR